MKTIISPQKYGVLSSALSRAQTHYELMNRAIREGSEVVPNLGPVAIRAAVERNIHMGQLLRYLDIMVSPEVEEE